MVRPQHRPGQAVTKRGMPGSGPAERMDKATPGLLCSSSSREHLDTVCSRDGHLGRLRQNIWDKKFPSGKDRIVIL